MIDRDLTAAGLPTLLRHAWVDVDLDQLATNAAALAAHVAPAALGAVVKADGYGHGLEMAARAAAAGGAQWLCVATAGEAARLRGDGYRGRVLVMYPPPDDVLDRCRELDIDVTVGSVAAAGRLAARPGPLRVHVEVDTGMTRGGVAPADAVAAVAALHRGPGTLVAGIWSHLAAPEDSAFTSSQEATFDAALDAVRAAGLPTGDTHLSASGGILSLDHSRRSFVRAGLAFYGVHPGAGSALPSGMAPALAVKAHPVRVAEVPAGTPVGYGGDWVSERPSTLATLPLGYVDGWARLSSPGTFALVAGRRVPLVGRVSSDAVVVDVTGVPGFGPESELTLLGSDRGGTVTADEVAAVRSTISWEVLQQLAARLSRVYRSGGVPVAVRPESATGVFGAPGAAADAYGEPTEDAIMEDDHATEDRR